MSPGRKPAPLNLDDFRPRRTGRKLTIKVPPDRAEPVLLTLMHTKVCSTCGQELPVSEFYVDTAKAKMPNSAWVSKCKECWRRAEKARYRALRARVIAGYGGRCRCCGESEHEFLAIDHVNGGGGLQRRTSGIRAGATFLKWIIDHDFPADLQVLCHNCNLAKGFHGECPHKRAGRAEVPA